MKHKTVSIALVACAGVLLSAGCARNISPGTYSSDTVGEVSSAQQAVVVGVRQVSVQSDGDSGAGTLAGGAIGGVAGSAIGGNSRVNAIGAIGGAVLGGIVGRKAEQGATHQTATEYVLRTDNGQTMTLVQGSDPVFAEGTHVLLLRGSRSRIIADPNYAQ